MRYLNYAGTSHPKPESVHRAVSEALAAPPWCHAELLEAATREILPEFSGPGELDLGGDLHFTSGCTAGLGVVLSHLPHREFVVTSQLEHEALLGPIKMLEGMGRLEHRELNYRPGTPLDLAQLEKLLQTERVGVVAVTSASNITGELTPLAEMAALTQKHEAVLVVDAAQSFGTDHFPVVAEFADVIVAGGHKAALGPHGVGVVFARPHVEFMNSAAVCEVGEAPCDGFLGYCDVGSVNLAGVCGLAAGLRSTRGRRELIGTRTRELAAELRAALAGLASVRLLGPVVGDEGLPIVSFVPIDWRLERLEPLMAEYGLAIRVGTHCAPQALAALGASEGCARVSFGEMSDSTDVSRILDFFANSWADP